MWTSTSTLNVFRAPGFLLATLLIVGCSSASKDKAAAGDATPPAKAAAPGEFSVEGVYVEACACKPPCGCEMTGVEHGCQGLSAMQITAGRYKGGSLAGAKVAYAMVPGEWVRIYVDADPVQKEAVTAFAQAAFAKYGPLEAVTSAAIDIQGRDGAYSVIVDGGKTMKFETEPVLGGDRKTPVAHTNIDSALNPTVYQGQNLSASYKDGARQINLPKGRNSYFNPTMNANGKV